MCMFIVHMNIVIFVYIAVQVCVHYSYKIQIIVTSICIYIDMVQKRKCANFYQMQACRCFVCHIIVN